MHRHHLEGLLNHIVGPYSGVSDLGPGPQIMYFSVPSDANADGDPGITLVTVLKVIDCFSPQLLLQLLTGFESVPQNKN